MGRIRRRNQLVTQLILVGVAIVVLAPVWVLVLLAIDGSFLTAPREFALWPKEPTADKLIEAWTRPGRALDFLGLLRNSLYVSLGAAGISLLFGATMAYAFARLRFPGASVGMFGILVGAFLPLIALATPLFMLFLWLETLFPLLRDVGFRGSTTALALLYAAFSMPLLIWLMRSAFRGVPNELEEAAFLEGASRWTTFRRITLPIAVPPILVAALIAFLLAYSESAIAWLFASSEENLTLAMILASAQTGVFSYEWGPLAAHALLMTFPVVIIVALLQRQLSRGALLGAAVE